MNGNLERDLRGALRKVPAPEILWERIEGGLDGPRVGGGRRFRWAIAAGLLSAIGASLLAFAGKMPDRDELATMTFQRVCGHPERLDLKTSDMAAVRQWVGTHNLVLQTASAAPGRVEIAGAASLPDRAGVAVSYRAGGEWAALVIEPSSEAPAKRVRRTTRNGLAIFEWSGQRQRYTVVTPYAGRAERACGICHDEVPGRTI